MSEYSHADVGRPTSWPGRCLGSIPIIGKALKPYEAFGFDSAWRNFSLHLANGSFRVDRRRRESRWLKGPAESICAGYFREASSRLKQGLL